MKKLALLLFIAAFAACTKFDCPSATPAQQRVLNYVSNAQFYRENERGRVSIRFYEPDITPKTVRLLFLQWAVTANAICRAGFTSKKNVKIK